ncbi:MAG: hypothetical protein R3B71_04045 [Candidatus Gracilibacteria bacterium]
MWFLITFVALNIISILAYLFMHQQVTRILEMQQRTFHLRNKVELPKKAIIRTRALYLLIVIGTTIYTTYLYVALSTIFSGTTATKR